MNSLKYVVTVISVCALSLSGCGSTSSEGFADTNTNWLRRCTQDPDCPSSLSCICGVCTESCEEQNSCAAFSAAAVCRTEERACGAEPVTLCALRETELGDSNSAPNDGGPTAEEPSDAGPNDISGQGDAGSSRLDGGSGGSGGVDSGAGSPDAGFGGPDASSTGVDAGMGSGGASTGGASTGGASTGGASTGGASSGGSGGAGAGGSGGTGSGGAKECAAPEGQDYPAETFVVPSDCGESLIAFGDQLVVSEEEFQLAYPCPVGIQSGIDFNVQQLYLAFVPERVEATLNYVHIDDAGDVTVGIDSPVYCGGAAPPNAVVPVLMNKTLRSPSTATCSSGKCIGPPPP